MVKSGDEVYVLVQDLIMDESTIRQAVDVFPNEKMAKESFDYLVETETPNIKAAKPNWKISPSESFFEACDEEDMYNNHYTIKIIKTNVH